MVITMSLEQVICVVVQLSAVVDIRINFLVSHQKGSGFGFTMIGEYERNMIGKSEGEVQFLQKLQNYQFTPSYFELF